MATTKFYLDTRTKKDKKAITMRVNHAGKSFNKGTGISIFPWDWDDKIGYPKDKTSEEFTELAAMESLLLGSYNSIKKGLRDVPSMDALKSTFEDNLARGGVTVNDNYTITGTIHSFIEQKESFYSKNTIKHYKKLEELVSDRFGRTAEDTIDTLNKTWALKFIDYLCYECQYQNSTVEMLLKKLISVLNFYDITPPFKIADVMQGMKKSKNVNSDKPYLVFEQINDIYEFVYMNWGLDSLHYSVFRIFMFGAYTGARYNELMSLTPSMVKDWILTYSTTKNGKRISVPLSDWCKVFVDHRNEKMLPQISNSVCNKILTEILEEYGMTDMVSVIRYSGKNMEVKEKSLAQLITFHSSRHSFASNLLDGGLTFQEVSDLMGISVQTLMSWYSHSNEEMRISKALAILNR
jgi:integrase